MNVLKHFTRTIEIIIIITATRHFQSSQLEKKCNEKYYYNNLYKNVQTLSLHVIKKMSSVPAL